MINFYRRFLPAAAKTQAPLHVLTHGAKKKEKRPLKWNQEIEQVFDEGYKKQLAKATLLAHPAENVPLTLCTDASDFAIGAVLEQCMNRQRKPLGFCSRKLTQAQTKYSAYDCELLAIYEAIEFFRYMVKDAIRQCSPTTNHLHTH